MRVEHERKNRGVCSSLTRVVLEDGVIRSVAVEGGCDGNLQGLCRLLAGRSAREAIELLSPLRCDDKATSCPAQIALCLQEALEEA